MNSIGTIEAQAHLPRLLARVAAGEAITITQHGKPVARLVPADPVETDGSKPDVERVIREMRAFRKANTLGGDVTVRDLIEEGRRY